MRKLGTICIILGIICLLLMGFLFAKNEIEDREAERSSRNVISQMIPMIEHPDSGLDTAPVSAGPAPVVPDPYDTEMTEKEIDGIMYVGYIRIPILGLELPVASQWNYPSLRISPCRYFGSSKTDNLVIAGHNYARHFGSLGSLNEGDEVILTDMDGINIHYEVVAVEILSPSAVEDMTAGKYDLTLFTCTYSTENRVTVRCDRIKAD